MNLQQQQHPEFFGQERGHLEEEDGILKNNDEGEYEEDQDGEEEEDVGDYIDTRNIRSSWGNNHNDSHKRFSGAEAIGLINSSSTQTSFQNHILQQRSEFGHPNYSLFNKNNHQIQQRCQTEDDFSGNKKQFAKADSQAEEDNEKSHRNSYFQHGINRISPNSRGNTNRRSQSPSISHLPDFLRQQESSDHSPRFFVDQMSSLTLQKERNLDAERSKKQQQRCELLFEQGEQKRRELNKKIQQQIIESKENNAECTFQPHSFTKNSIYRTQTTSTLSVVERAQIWNEQKQMKLDTIKQSDKDRDLQGCTFAPEITSSQKSHLVNMTVYPSSSGACLNGVDKFLRRQVLARRAREELEFQKENPFCHVESKSLRKQRIHNNTNNPGTLMGLNQIQSSPFNKMKMTEFDYKGEIEKPEYSKTIFDKAVRQLRQELHDIQI